jgi:hypothetical protein
MTVCPHDVFHKGVFEMAVIATADDSPPVSDWTWPGTPSSITTTTRLQGGSMATPQRRYGPAGGLTMGGIIVILGIVLIFAWSFWWGLIIALVGLIFFGGFARGRWY